MTTREDENGKHIATKADPILLGGLVLGWA